MKIRLNPLCWVNRHAPLRNRTRWDGNNFISKCRFCDADIRRLEHGGWRREWLERSSSP
ncbi:MAG: hypothetical protein ACKOPO_11025 [Novosphingobium sp.]